MSKNKPKQMLLRRIQIACGFILVVGFLSQTLTDADGRITLKLIYLAIDLGLVTLIWFSAQKLTAEK